MVAIYLVVGINIKLGIQLYASPQHSSIREMQSPNDAAEIITSDSDEKSLSLMKACWLNGSQQHFGVF